MKYLSTNNFSVGKMDFFQFPNSFIKRQREDFNDMFVAENNYRISRGDISLVFVLTYNDEHIHNMFGQNMLDSDDLKCYAKSSRFAKFLRRSLGYTFDFVCVGEYGQGGATHNYHGSRGVGNNPHYHCVGWFHRVGSRNQSSLVRWFMKIGLPLDLAMYNDVDLLPLLVRYEWQKCLESNPVTYGCNPWLRSKGLGYVKLDGEVRSSYSGGSYIGKYIGKDIRALYLSCYKDYFVPNLVTTLYSAIHEWLYNSNQSYDVRFEEFDVPMFELDYYSVIYHWAFDNKLKSVLRFYPFIPSDLPAELLHQKRLWYNGEFLCVSMYDVLCEYLTEHYKMFKEEFESAMTTKYSPKVRKFHGFGYSLLQDANIEHGTYTVRKKSCEIERMLPPSLSRHLYYDFSVVDGFDPLFHTSKSVRYFLNEKGRKHLAYSLKSSVLRDLTYINNFGSVELKQNALQVSIATHCLLLYNPVKNPSYSFADYVTYFWQYLNDLDFAVSYAVECRQKFAYWVPLPENREFLDIDSFFKTYFPDIYKLVEELRHIHFDLAEKKDIVDGEYNSHLYNTYVHTY